MTLSLQACNFELAIDSADQTTITLFADAGPDQTAPPESLVTLGGRNGHNSMIQDYQWKSLGSIELSSYNTANPTFTIPTGLSRGAKLRFELVVSDYLNNRSRPSTVAITVGNAPPTIATRKNLKIPLGDIIKLDGSATKDLNNDVMTFSWSVISAPRGSTALITNHISDKPDFTPDIFGQYVLQLEVSDGINTSSDIINVHANNLEAMNMIALNGGSFLMGDETSIPGIKVGSGDGFEAPLHKVDIAPFEIGKFEVTFSQYDQYLRSRSIDPSDIPIHDDKGLVNEAVDPGWGRGNHPVTNVSWEDIQAFINWLNSELDIELDDPNRYRLPSEAEWEYAARGGTNTTYSFGDCINTSQANYYGKSSFEYTKADGTKITCSSTDIYHKKALPVGSYPANAFGLHDMHGNESEWVEDCMHRTYSRNPPTDGSAWISDCYPADSKMIRGGSWSSNISELRSAVRRFQNQSRRQGGFRLARSL